MTVAISMSILLSLTIMIPLCVWGYGGSAVVEIGEGGVAEVILTLVLDEGIQEVAAPIEPIAPTVMATANNRSIPIAYYNRSFYLVLDTRAEVVVTYIANVSIANNIFQLGIETGDTVEVRVSKDVVLLTWPGENLVDVRLEQDNLVLYVRGPLTLSYTLRLPPTSTTPPTSPSPQPSPSPTPRPTPSPTATTSPPTSTTAPPQPGYSNIAGVAVAVGAIAVGAAALYIYIRRRRGGEMGDVLGDVDVAIVKALEARGGSALQTELQIDVRVPKTTLWRHVKKLERLGIVRVEKVGLQNRVVLVKRVRV